MVRGQSYVRTGSAPAWRRRQRDERDTKHTLNRRSAQRGRFSVPKPCPPTTKAGTFDISGGAHTKAHARISSGRSSHISFRVDPRTKHTCISQTNACTTAHTPDPYARGIRVRHCLSHSGHRAVVAAVHYNDRSMAGASPVYGQLRKVQHEVSVNTGAYTCKQAITASHNLTQQFKAMSQQIEFPHHHK